MLAPRAAALSAALLGGTLGCVPPASFRAAPGLMDGKTVEVGGGGMLVGPRPYVEEPVSGAGQVWSSARATPRLTLTGIAAFDTAAFALGGAGRYDLVRTGRFALGGEAELGFAWVGAVVPVGVRLFDETWLYSAPRVASRGVESTGVAWSLELPAGVSVRVVGGLSLRAEYRVSWVDLFVYTRRHHGGLAIAYQY
jgi:hypothetical protein